MAPGPPGPCATPGRPEPGGSGRPAEPRGADGHTTRAGPGDLSLARLCHLTEADGTCWEVLEVTLTGRRAWVTARRERAELPDRTFDVILGPGVHLIWTFPDGRTLRARDLARAPEGEVRWEREPPQPPPVA